MYDSSLKVLLIEDNPGDARLILETLKASNTTRYELEWVGSLSLGLEQLTKEVFDVVLLDLSLPDSHGSETLERTLSQSNEVPIVVLTGLDDEELEIHALRHGAQDYLIKEDVNSALLGRSIRYAIERKRTEVALKKAHDRLEEKVRERTDAFVKQNKKLTKEIKERKQMEDALRKSETKYRELVQNANSIIYQRDTEGNITFFNEYAQRFFGYSEEEILGKNVVGKIVPEVDSTGNDLTAMIAEISADPGRYVVNENENIRRNGEHVWIAWTNKALCNEDGTIREILCIGNDTTERRKIKEKLRESENWYRTLFETTGTGTVIIEEDTTVSQVNKQVQTITGYSEEELIGQNWREFIAGDDFKRMEKYHEMRRRDPEAVPHNYKFSFVDKNGDKKEILANVSMIPGTKKSIASLLDITEQRRLAEEVQKSLRQYRLLADNVSDIIWIMDTDLRFTYISPSVKSLRGFSVEEALNQTLAETLTSASLEIAMKTFAEQGKLETMKDKDPTRAEKLELELTCKDGSTVWCEANMTGLRNSDGQVYGILGVTRNITDRIRAREALEIKSRSLEESNTALRVLLNQVDQNRQELQSDVLYNVNQLILPYIEKLKVCRTDNDRDTCLQVLETNLDNIVSPFLRNMTLTHYKLTPKELQVANLVKEGKMNKEIADLLHLSIRSIEFHRDNIRKKLGLKNRKANLRSFLLSLK